MLRLLLPRSTRHVFRTLAHGIEQTIQSAKGRTRPVFTAVHTREELARITDEARALATGSCSLAWRLSVVRKERDVTGVVLWLERPETLAFEAGQFLTVAVMIDGEEHRRQYSIFTDPEDRNVLGIAVRQVKNGRVSNYLANTLSEQDCLSADGPSGRFTLATVAKKKPVVLLAGGVGVTPLLSIARAAQREGREVTLVCANRGVRSILLRHELEAVSKLSGVQVIHVLERRASSLPCPVGRLDAELLASLIPLERGSDYFVCGPEPMMDSVCATLASAGISEGQVHTERFVVARHEGGTASGRTHAVRFVRTGRLVNIGEGETILEGARAAGIELASSCTMGGCAACKVRVEGDVHLPDPNCLTREEAAAGETLTCIACPRSSLTIDA